MKAYDKYVPSGVEWIGNIPEGWEVKKLKYLYSIYNGATPKSDNDDFWNGDIVWITPADYSTETMYIKSSNRKITYEGLTSCATKLVPEGSIVISNRAPIGTVSIAAVPLTTNQGCKTLVKKTNVDDRFIYYFLSTQSNNLNALGKGTTFLELSNNELSSFCVPVPQYTLQYEIANYLDTETARIDKLIKAKETLIERLKEKRTALITNAVTKGINPNAKMKPSGIEWIGDIPEDWEVKKLKYLYLIYNGATPKSDNDDFWNGDIVWITPADYSTETMYIKSSNRKITYEGLTSCATKLVPEGSIVISNRAPIGTVSIAAVPLTTNQGCKTLVKKTNVDDRFIYYFLSTQSNNLNALGKGTTFLELSNSDLSSFYAPLPKYKLQKEIANYLDSETIKIKTIINKTQSSIEKLKEYRTALISACVTGKIDVRSV